MMGFAKTRQLVILLLCFLVSQQSKSQNLAIQPNTITLNEQLIIDATVHRDARPGQEFRANTNYGAFSRISSAAWTNSGAPTYWRSYMYFNLSQIPAGSIVTSATLYLYSDPAFPGTSQAEGNSQLSGSNSILLDKVTGEWFENTITWNSQPTTTTTGRIWVAPSTSTTESRQINIQSFVQGWVNDPISNNGFRFMLENEGYYRSRNYASSDHANANLRPRIEITFTPPTSSTISCGTPDISESEYYALPWYGDENYLQNANDSLSLIYDGASFRTTSTTYGWFRVPVKFWVYQIGAGNPGGNPQLFPGELQFQRMLDNLNNGFRNNGINLQFYLDNITFVNDATGINPNGIQRTALSFLNSSSDKLNVHIVDDINDAAGVYNPINNNSIFIQRSVGFGNGPATFTHEVGHFYGLLHTHIFNGIICLREPVSRGRKITVCPNGSGYTKRCNFTGDLLCDTGADPDMSRTGAYNANNCTWDPQGERDHYGDLYSPGTRNFMSYGNDACERDFSSSQKHIIHLFATTRQNNSSQLKTEANRFDSYEPDDAAVASRNILFGQTQDHTFHTSGRIDNTDWINFVYPATGVLGDIQVRLTDLDQNATAGLRIHRLNNQNAAVEQITNFGFTTVNNVRTYTLQCSSFIPGVRYALEVLRGVNGITVDYQVSVSVLANGGTPTISGSSTICPGSATSFSLSNLPAGATVQWQLTPTNWFSPSTGSGTSFSTTLLSGQSGAASIVATISGGCANSTQLTRTLSAGLPRPVQAIAQGFLTDQPFSVCPNSIYQFSAVDGLNSGVTYQWQTYGNHSIANGQGSAFITLVTGNYVDFTYLSVAAQNVCGNGPWTDATLVQNYNSCFGNCDFICSFSVSPNPATETLNIDYGGADDTIPEYQLSLINANGEKVFTRKSDSKRNSVNLRGLKKGAYVLIVSNGKESVTRHIKID